MKTTDLTWQEWQRLDVESKLAAATRIASALPASFQIAEATTFVHDAVGHEVVILDGLGASFVLVPGGEVELGFDVDRFQPTAAQLESYRDSAVDYGLPESIHEFLATVLTPTRTVSLPPLLVEIEPFEVGLSPMDPSHPEVLALLEQHKQAGQVEVHKTIRVKRFADGQAAAWRITSTEFGAFAAELRATGARLPTSDEWEFLCGAGARTLFRWGDDCPCDRYPVDASSGWNPHKQRNALGLRIAQNPYDFELVSEPKVRRGGDGGCNICGGAGFFLGWLPLATAYRDDVMLAELCEDEDISNAFARRVIDLNG